MSDELERFRKALQEIADAYPRELRDGDSAYDYVGCHVDDAWQFGFECGIWDAAKIAREALGMSAEDSND